MAVAPTIIKRMIAKTLATTKIFSTRAASVTPRESKSATKSITIAETKSITPPLLPRGLAKELGNFKPRGAIKPRKLADNPDPTNATAIKYSANKAQPATQPKNSPKITLIQE